MSRKSITFSDRAKKRKRTITKKRKRTITKKRKRTSRRPRLHRGGGGLNDASDDIFTNVTEFLNNTDRNNVALTNKGYSKKVKQFRDLKTTKAHNERTNFIAALTRHLDYRNTSEMYIFDLDKIKKHLINPDMNVNLTNNLTNNSTNSNEIQFNLDEESNNMVSNLDNTPLYRESLINTVIEFIPDKAYALVRRYLDERDIKLSVYNHDGSDLKEDGVNDILLVTNAGAQRDINAVAPPSANILLLGRTVTNIGSYAFYDCTSITTIIIPDSVITIGDYAFYGCTSLTTVIIPDSVITIGDYAFYECTSLTNITITNPDTTIGRFAFEGCPGEVNRLHI